MCLYAGALNRGVIYLIYLITPNTHNTLKTPPTALLRVLGLFSTLLLNGRSTPL